MKIKYKINCGFKYRCVPFTGRHLKAENLVCFSVGECGPHPKKELHGSNCSLMMHVK